MPAASVEAADVVADHIGGLVGHPPKVEHVLLATSLADASLTAGAREEHIHDAVLAELHHRDERQRVVRGVGDPTRD